MLDGGNATDDMSGETNRYGTNFTGMGGTQQAGARSLGRGADPGREHRGIPRLNLQPDGGLQQLHRLPGPDGDQARHQSSFTARPTGIITPPTSAPPIPGPTTTRRSPLRPARCCRPIRRCLPTTATASAAAWAGRLLPRSLGGKTFFFVNYEGLRYPNVSTYERPVPTDTMRAGVIFVPNSAGTYLPYNLNPNPVTVNGDDVSAGHVPRRAPAIRAALGSTPSFRRSGRTCPSPTTRITPRNGGDGYNVAGFLSSIRAAAHREFLCGPHRS